MSSANGGGMFSQNGDFGIQYSILGHDVLPLKKISDDISAMAKFNFRMQMISILVRIDYNRTRWWIELLKPTFHETSLYDK